MSTVVAISGASSGIGAATARRLAADGHTVLLGDRRTDRLRGVVADVEQRGGAATATTLDVTDRRDVERFVAGAVERHGRLDAYVSGAGLMSSSRLDALHVPEWDRMIDVNIRGLLHSIAALLPQFARQGGGHLVSVASVGAYEVSPTTAVCCATEIAARAITEGLRREAVPGVRVTSITPGVVDTELAATTDPVTAEAMAAYRRHAVAPSTVADAIACALAQPTDVDVGEVVVRPTRRR